MRAMVLLLACSVPCLTSPCAEASSVRRPVQQMATLAKPSAGQPTFVYVTLVNMSGKSRQAIAGTERIDLPVGQRVALKLKPGTTLRIVSDTQEALVERFVISPTDAARYLIVR